MEKITRDEAVQKIKDWVDLMESADPDAPGFDEAIEGLIVPVKNGRLDFNLDDMTFSYKLLSPIVGEKQTREILKVHEVYSNDYKVTQRYKEEEKIDKNEALIGRSCDLLLGEVSKIGSRDLTVLGTIITVFFA